VVFIFATTEIRKVPQTIQSRVQRFDFKRISELKIKKRVEYICSQEGISPESEALEIISTRAGGSMRDALSLFDQVYAFSGEQLSVEAVRKVLGIPPDELYDKMCSAIINQDKKACFETLEEFYTLGIEMFEFLNGFGQYLRNLLCVKQPEIPPSFLNLSNSRIDRLREVGKELQDGDIIRFSKIISDLLFELRSAPNPRLTVELGIVKLASLDRVVLISKLLKNNLQDEADAVKKKAHESHDASAAVNSVSSSEEKSTDSAREEFTPTSIEQTEQTKKKEPLERNSGSIDTPPDYIDEVHSPGHEEPWEMDFDEEELPERPMETEEAEKEAPVVRKVESLQEIIDIWPAIVAEMMNNLPLLAGYFLDTSLEFNDASPPVLKVIFEKDSKFNLVQTDRSNVQSLKAVIQKKLINQVPFQIAFELKRNLEETEGEILKGAGPMEGKGEKKEDLDEEELVLREPIIGYILEKFDGKIVD
jgi:DNA polymerase III gamma/tau subunit